MAHEQLHFRNFRVLRQLQSNPLLDVIQKSVVKNVLDTLDMYLVDTMDEVLKIALAEPLPTLAAPATEAANVQPAISDDTITH